MSKVGISELAAGLQSKHQLTKEDAEHFIRLMFDVLNDGLHYEKTVKLKGLGTFKVMKVSARKSVDVNTGEPIVIEGRNKITFIPEAAIKELINRPFSQFETVVLNEGVELDDVETEAPSEPEEETAELPVEEAVAPTEEAEAAPIAAVETPFKEAVKPAEEAEAAPTATVETPLKEAVALTEEDEAAPTATVETPLKETVETAEETEEVQTIDIPTPLMEAMSAPDPVEEPAKVISKEEEKVPVIHQKEPTTEDKADDQATLLLQKQLTHAHSLIRILTVSVILLAIICCVGAYYVGKQFALRDNRLSHMEAMLHTATPAKQPAKIRPVTTVTPQQPPAAATPKPVPAPEKQQQPVTETKAKPAKKIQREAKPDPYDSDPRVRTGAYRIIGVDQVVTVRKSQTLSSISRTYLGPGMECYVEAINGTKDVREGQKIKIPKLKLRKK